MKTVLSFTLCILSFFLLIDCLIAQNKKGNVIEKTFLANSLKANIGGENPVRRLSIYTPPGYNSGSQRYPVVYFLHGFGVDDSLMMEWNGLNELMDSAINSGRIRPMIMVLPNSDTRYHGSFYTNSAVTGNWADYIVKDVVEYTDKNFRTIPDKNSRGLCGHSMGGNGTIKIAMLYPGVFGAAYALSPAVLSISADFYKLPSFKSIENFKNDYIMSSVIAGLQKGDPDAIRKFYTLAIADLSRTYSPNMSNPQGLGHIPVTYVGDSMVLHEDIVKLWDANSPMNIADSYMEALKSLKAFKLDWGRYDVEIAVAGLAFSKKLEKNKITHFAEEYIGGHIDKLAGYSGRFYTDMFPFFDAYLKFEDKK